MTSLDRVHVLVGAGRPRAARRARRLHAQRRVEHARRAASRPAWGTTRSWSCCTPGCWSACWSRRGRAGPTCPAALAWSMLARRRAHPGAALVVHRARSGRRWNTRVIVVPGLPPVTGGPYRFLTHPNYVAVVRRGRRAAARARLLDHRPRLHGAQRRPADGADPGRERRARHPARRRARVPSAVTSSSPAAARSAWPPRCTPPAPASRSWSASRGPAPVDKACGEGLMPGAVADLADLGVDPDGPPDRRHRLRRRRAPGRGRRSGTATAAGSAARPCTRALHDAVAAAGVKVEQRAGRRRSRTAATTCSSTASRRRYLVAADGLHSPIRRLLGLERAARAAPPVRPAQPRRGRAVDALRRGALGAAGPRPT